MSSSRFEGWTEGHVVMKIRHGLYARIEESELARREEGQGSSEIESNPRSRDRRHETSCEEI